MKRDNNNNLINIMMKTKVLLFAALLMAAWGAQAGNDDTLKVHRVYFNGLEKVQFSGYCKVEVVNDSATYLEFNDPSTTELPQGLEYRLSGKGLKNLNIEAASGVGKFRMHLEMDASVSIETEDYAQVEVLLPPKVVKLSVLADDYSRVNVSTLKDVDTLRSRYIILKGEDYATVSLKTPCVVDEIGLRAEDYALVNVTYCKGDKLYVSEVDRGRVNVAAHNMQTTESTADYNFSGEEFLSMTDDVLGKPKTSEVKRVARSITDDFRFDFLWGFHNWGSTPFNGLMRMDGGYALQTTFSSYQLEAVYYPMVSDNWRLGLGLGYGSDVYKFSDDYVAVVDDNTGTMQTFTPMDPADGGQWSTKLTARYVTLPLMVRWEPGNSNFFIGLAAIPGLNYNGKHTGLKHKAEYPRGNFNDRDNVSKVMNPFRMDARLSIGWQNLYAFLQVAMLPVNTGMDKEVYPIKLGVALSLGDD